MLPVSLANSSAISGITGARSVRTSSTRQDGIPRRSATSPGCEGRLTGPRGTVTARRDPFEMTNGFRRGSRSCDRKSRNDRAAGRRHSSHLRGHPQIGRALHQFGDGRDAVYDAKPKLREQRRYAASRPSIFRFWSVHGRQLSARDVIFSLFPRLAEPSAMLIGDLAILLDGLRLGLDIEPGVPARSTAARSVGRLPLPISIVAAAEAGCPGHAE